MHVLKAVMHALTPRKASPPVVETAVPNALPQVNSEWVKLDAWPDFVPTWDYVLGEGNSAIERACDARIDAT